MIPKSALIPFFVSLCASLARADAIPTEPGTGAVFNAGGECHIAWEGDSDSTTAWKNMSIELMTGSNFQMVHLTSMCISTLVPLPESIPFQLLRQIWMAPFLVSSTIPARR